MIIMALPHVPGFDVVEKIGVGSFSVVYKAISKSSSKETVAVKCIDKRYQKKSFADNVFKEISLLKILKHEHIVELKDFTWDAKHIFIITEYCNEGDLSKFIRKHHKLNEKLVLQFMQQLGSALQYLHGQGVCHMDLKPQNLLLSSTPKLNLKVADFGLSTFLTANGQDTEHCRFAGSLLYMAPEKLLNQQFDARVDLWSVGIIMFECLFGRPPYHNMNTKGIVNLMTKKAPIELPPHANITKDCEDMLKRLLKHNPEERLSFEQFFEHNFLDLAHQPTPENYQKAVTLVQEAIELDKRKKYAESLPKYREAIKYFEAFITSETDTNIKAMMSVRVNEYIQWSNALSESLNGTGAVPKTMCQPIPLTENQYEILCSLSAMTPNLASALEIGQMGELYIAEGKYSIALTKLKGALGILMPLLQNEPPGLRRDMLHSQVQKWLHMAETLKSTYNIN